MYSRRVAHLTLKNFAKAALALVALLHVWFFVLETVLWRSAFAQQALQMTASEAEATAVLAGNQGVYNAVFACGLSWCILTKIPTFAQALTRFFLVAVIVVGLYGAVSARITVFYIQVLPAALALGLHTMVWRKSA